MLLQTNSYLVPKEKRAEHARLLRRFRQVLHKLGCDQFEVYEQVGSNWNTSEPTGRYVQIMKFRDRRHQVAVQSAERSDPSAQALIAEFCQLINFPYQQQQGLFAVGFYNGVIAGSPLRGGADEAAAAAAGAGAAGAAVAWPDAEQAGEPVADSQHQPAEPPAPDDLITDAPAGADAVPVSGETAAAVEEELLPASQEPAPAAPEPVAAEAAGPVPQPVAEAASDAQTRAMDAEELAAMAVESDRPEGQKAVLPPPLPEMPPVSRTPPPLPPGLGGVPAAAEGGAAGAAEGVASEDPAGGEDDLSALLEGHVGPDDVRRDEAAGEPDDLELTELEIESEAAAPVEPSNDPWRDRDHVAR